MTESVEDAESVASIPTSESEFVAETDGVREIERFTHLLINRENQQDRTSNRLRTQGMVAFVRMAGSLGGFQTECLDSNRYYDSLTARYRIQSGDTFGTLLAAFLSDLTKLMEGRAEMELLGRFDPHPSTGHWMRLFEDPSSPLRDFLSSWLKTQQGVLQTEQLGTFFSILSNESVLDTKTRLILFAEVIGSDGDPNGVAEWRQASELLFNSLPERMGLVVSGIPQGFDIPTAPHFLTLELDLFEEDGGDAGDKSYKYTDAPLHTDRPTNEDRLGLYNYAAALARFILHPQTKPPLTIGIHGRWGKGKSSFMEMLNTALVNFALDDASAKSRLTRIDSEWDSIARIIDTLDYSGDQRHLSLSKLRKLTKKQEQLTRKRDRLEESNDLLAEKRRQLADDPEQLLLEMRVSALDHIVTVRFNAWQFEDAIQTWAGLASIISERLESALPWWRRTMMRIAYAWNRHKPQILFDLFPWVMVVFIVVVIAIYLSIHPETGASLFGNELLKPDDPLGTLLTILLPAGSIWALAWRATKVVQPVSERVVGYVTRPDHHAQMGYQHRVMEDLQFVYTHLKNYRPDCKVAVYIDDLDRCSDEKIMQILQAINLILASCDFFVFLGMDTEMIHRAIRVHYHTNQESEVLPASFPEDYLRKILQLSFHLPETPSEKLFDLTSRLFSDTAREALAAQDRTKAPAQEARNDAASGRSIDGQLRFNMESVLKKITIEEVVDTSDELEAFRDHQKFLEDNPREIKRLVNVHRLVKILLQQAGISWPVERQRKLVKWLIFCSRWPQLVDDLLDQVGKSPDAPDCLGDLIESLDLPAAQISRLKDFASNKEHLSSKDISGDFTLAARISQMVLVSLEPRRASAWSVPGENGSHSHSLGSI